MKKLPIGISTFEKIRMNDCYYVDKTPFVQLLSEHSGGYYFLSRPRRFGKSLFVDTLKCAFEGNKDLFTGLYLEKNWNFEETYPVISISFGRGVVKDRDELDHRILRLLSEQASYHGVTCEQTLVADRFAELIWEVWKKTGKPIVILVDEYDKPILDHIEDPAKAGEMRDGLKNFYSVIKESDRYIRFCFITGVSKFSRLSIFSDLNNLEDLTLQPEMGALCGYTESELKETFHDRLDGVDMNTLREWYNGYSFLGEETVYNPFDVLLFLKKRLYGNYWFESATPSFLIKLLYEQKVYLPDLSRIEIDQGLLSGFDLTHLLPEAILFQSGYLTIKSMETLAPGQRIFTLDYPNQEVRVSLNMHLLRFFTSNGAVTGSLRLKISKALKSREMDKVKAGLQSLFSSIPYEWYTAGNLDRYEGYYASVLYAFLASLGFDLHPEESSSHGRADLVLKTDQTVYVMEFKVVEIVGDGEKAINQIREKGYHKSYISSGLKVVLVGMDFSRKERNLVGFAFEMV